MFEFNWNGIVRITGLREIDKYCNCAMVFGKTCLGRALSTNFGRISSEQNGRFKHFSTLYINRVNLALVQCVALALVQQNVEWSAGARSRDLTAHNSNEKAVFRRTLWHNWLRTESWLRIPRPLPVVLGFNPWKRVVSSSLRLRVIKLRMAFQKAKLSNILTPRSIFPLRNTQLATDNPKILQMTAMCKENAVHFIIKSQQTAQENLAPKAELIKFILFLFKAKLFKEILLKSKHFAKTTYFFIFCS